MNKAIEIINERLDTHNQICQEAYGDDFTNTDRGLEEIMIEHETLSDDTNFAWDCGYLTAVKSIRAELLEI